MMYYIISDGHQYFQMKYWYCIIRGGHQYFQRKYRYCIIGGGHHFFQMKNCIIRCGQQNFLIQYCIIKGGHQNVHMKHRYRYCISRGGQKVLLNEVLYYEMWASELSNEVRIRTYI